jgi:hypothetical protein
MRTVQLFRRLVRPSPRQRKKISKAPLWGLTDGRRTIVVNIGNFQNAADGRITGDM